MLYWGSQGITRDISAALEYYRQAAESGNPQALYDYGIVLLKVNVSSRLEAWQPLPRVVIASTEGSVLVR